MRRYGLYTRRDEDGVPQLSSPAEIKPIIARHLLPSWNAVGELSLDWQQMFSLKYTRMKRLVLNIRKELFLELIDAAAECYEKDERRDCNAESFAVECIESALATRRLNRLTAIA